MHCFSFILVPVTERHLTNCVVKRKCRELTRKAEIFFFVGMLKYMMLCLVCLSVISACVACDGGDTEVTLKRDPKTDGLRRATQKANVKCRAQTSDKSASTQKL